MNRSVVIIVGSIVFVFIVIIVIALAGQKGSSAKYQFDLSVWGVFDNTSDYKDAFAGYQLAHPFLTDLTYKKFTIDTYRDDLINALAAGNGPDVFMIHNTWLPDFVDKIQPAPGYIMTEQEYRTRLVDVAAQDGMIGEQIFAIPLSVDSLALYYNKDIFNASGITSPPKTWGDFTDAVKRITVRSEESDEITQSAAALGTAENINRSPDLFTVLALQGGVEMSQNGRATFAEKVTIEGEVRTPAKQALAFYTQFSRPSSGDDSVYTWNARQQNSIDAFGQGDTAMMINYSWHYDTIKSKNAKLNFAVAPLPQIDGSGPESFANQGNYWMFVVAKNKVVSQNVVAGFQPYTNEMRVHESWQFLRALTLAPAGKNTLLHGISGDPYTITLQQSPAEIYIETTRKPAARKDLIDLQIDDVRLAPFAGGNLIARSWVRKNSEQIDRTLAEMITDINRGKSTIEDALRLAQQRATQLMQ